MKIIKTLIVSLVIFALLYHTGSRLIDYFCSPKAATLYNQKHFITGTITSLPEVSATRTKFHFKTAYGTFLVSIYGRLSLRLNLKPADTWRFKLKIKPIRSLLNPGGFDYKQYLKAKGIDARAYVIKSSKNQKIGHFWYRDPINLLRFYLKKQVMAIAPKRYRGIFLALILGDRSELDEQTWNIFKRTGTSHLIAISGLHIGLVFGLVFLIMRFGLGLIPMVHRRFVAQDYALLVAMSAAFIYSALAGFAISTLRALIMLGLLCVFKLKRQLISLGKVFILTIIISLILAPLSVISASFWLSFCAVGALIYGLSGKKKIKHDKSHKWKKLIRPQWVIFWLLIPLNLYYFQQISLVSLGANIVAIPLMSLLIIPLLLLAIVISSLSLPSAKVLFQLADFFFSILWHGLHWLSTLPFWGIHLPGPSFFSLIGAILGLLLCFAPKAIPGRHLSGFYLLGILFIRPLPPPYGSLRFTMLDVGQGLSCVLQTQHHVLIYDAGAAFSGGFNAGRSVILPYLHAQNIFLLNKLVISHGDNDHAGGATYLLNNIKVQKLETSDLKQFNGYYPIFCHGKKNWQWDGVHFHYLQQPKNITNRNDGSCVLKITVGKRAILLPGDIEKQAERYLLVHQKSLLSASILIAPHHGSLTSSSVPFVKAVQPTIVLMSTGFNNRFGFPKKAVIQRYEHIGASIYNTAVNGAIQLDISKSDTKISLMAKK